MRLSDLDADPRLFWDRVAVGDGCWEWQGGRFANGYGAVQYRKRLAKAHRVAYSLWHGVDLPSSRYLHARHHCDNPGCVRPDHLSFGTASENSQDRDNKRRGLHSRKDACARGHMFTDENTYRRPDGGRNCRACGRENARRYAERKAA